MRTKINRRCSCGCGEITRPGNRYIQYHNWNGRKHTKETKRKISLALMGKFVSEETKRKISLSHKGFKHSEESKLKMSLIQLAKPHPEDEYCNEWRDKEYKKDLRKDYCENVDCKGNYKRLLNHHIDLNKKNCHPSNIMTLCVFHVVLLCIGNWNS